MMKILQKYLFSIIVIFDLLIQLTSSQECPRDKPILKSNECVSIYCTPEQFASKTCIISNDLTKIQWLNNFHIFDEKYMYYISVTENYKGELFLSSQKVIDDFDTYFFAFDSEGEGLFYDKEKDKYNCFEIIDFPVREYDDSNNYIEIDNKGYLIAEPTDDDIYLIDYMNKTMKQFSIKPYAKSSDTIFQMKNAKNMVFTSYIYCQDRFNKECFLHFQSYKISTEKLERVKNITNITTVIGSRINCNQNDQGYIFCFYAEKVGENITYEHDEEDGTEIPIITPILDFKVSAINPDTFKFEDSYLMKKNFTLPRMFCETLNLKNDLYIIAYSINDSYIRIQFKTIKIDDSLNNKAISYVDYFSKIHEIYINKDQKFLINYGSYKRNDLYKISDNKFALFLKEFSKDQFKDKNTILLIYIFTVYNNDKNINLRRYSIDFTLYNKRVNDEIRGYKLGEFFGVVLGLTKTKDDSQSISTFMTFGYVNTTEQEDIDTKLKYNDTDSKIVISQYINEMENNLFGYEFQGVKIISLPSEENSGYFINSITNKKIQKDDIIKRESELQFILSKTFVDGVYTIEFAGIMSEPSYEVKNKLAEELITYPENEEDTENQFYQPKILIGKKMKYKFRLSECYDSCLECYSFSKDDNDHKCKSCRTGFYFKEGTNNCYDKIDTKYYFDEDDKMFKPCYEKCLTCSTKEESEKEMNCLSCENELRFYNKSKNCFNCSKYINYEQNECIDEIPDGYYLEDKESGIIGKCDALCKTCIAGPYKDKYNRYHMNCKTCLYKDDSFKPIYDGDCPESPEVDPDAPVDGKCPINKPILKYGKCQLIYCTNEEYKSQVCKILNDIVKTQWLNNFHIFSDSNTSSVSIADDIIDNQKIILFAQNINKDEGYIEKYIYGFYKNGTGIFYDKNKNIFDSFKKMSFTEKDKLVDKIGYIEIDDDGYILTTPINNYLYLIDYKDNKITKKLISPSAYSADKIILMEEEDEERDPDYTTCYIYCKSSTNLNNCYLMMKTFEANEAGLTEISSMEENIKVNYNSQLNCYKDEQNYFRCTYTKHEDNSNYKHVLGIYSSGSYKLMKELELENNYDQDPTFDSMIRLKNFVSIIAYSMGNNKNIIKILIKKINNNKSEFEINDYITKIPEILLNEDNLYKFEGGKASSNSLTRITNDKFALLVNDFKNSQDDYLNSKIVIYILTIYDSYSKINIRHYQINFDLYNTFIDRKLIGYNLNGFFGTLIELSSPENKYLKRASFFTFGYVNSTDDINPMEGNEILIVKKEKLILSNYIKEIENNLFGYEFSTVKVISVPDSKLSGYFTINKTIKLKAGDIISKNSEIEFTINNDPKTGNYAVVFAPVIKQSSNYDIMNSYCTKLETYPKGEKDTEKNFYESSTILGKYFTFNFYIKGTKPDCFRNCKTCYKESDDINDQQCIECQNNYYKINSTNNCYDSAISGYYFDENKKLFMPCYKDCLTCNKGGNITKMNCLTCDDDEFDYYKKSTNCLFCQKYVDYTQTKCINEIPEGYFMDDPILKTIDKCHDLCKTCENKAYEENGITHMNCKTCKYTNSNFKDYIKGNCPETQGEEKESSNAVALVISIATVIMIIAVAIIVYMKCFRKKEDTINKDMNEYFNNEEGKNIPFDDEGIIN